MPKDFSGCFCVHISPLVMAVYRCPGESVLPRLAHARAVLVADLIVATNPAAAAPLWFSMSLVGSMPPAASQ